jgi:hypothetical protein
MIDDAGMLRRLAHTILSLLIDTSEFVGSSADVPINQQAYIATARCL